MTEEEKKNQIRKLSIHLAERAEECLFKKNKLDIWRITDPEKVDEYHNLLALLDQACTFYLKDSLPWDRDIVFETEVIQSHPEDIPVSVKVKRYDFRPSIMQAARDLFLFIALS